MSARCSGPTTRIRRSAGDRRDRRTTAVEDHDVGARARRRAAPLPRHSTEHGTGQPAAGAAAADGRDAARRRGLEVVGGRMTPRAGARDQLGHRRRRRRRPRARAGRRDPSQRRRPNGRGRAVARGGPSTAVLPTRLPVPITATEGSGNASSSGWVEAEVGADVRQPGGERARHPAEPLGRPEHGLVGQVDDDLGPVESVDERHAVVGARPRSFSVPPTRIAPTHS